MDDNLHNDSIFWIEVQKIEPNPYQPRKEFDENRLRDLADSIRQYGVLQPLVVTRKETTKDDGGLVVTYELIAGERRLRASRLAGLYQVPAVIRTGEQTDKMKLEIAIIENLQREDLNPVDRAQAFALLANDFSLKHVEIAKKIGKSREYVSNSLRILALPQDILDALVNREITEGHTRPILMLTDHPAEQLTLFKEITLKKLTVREAENIARRIAFERIRKKEKFVEPEIVELEDRLTERFGTRVKVEKKAAGGQVTIDFFTAADLKHIVGLMDANMTTDLEAELATNNNISSRPLTAADVSLVDNTGELGNNISEIKDEENEDDDELYSLKNFTV